ncbi:hypothetical protein SAMN05880582_10286 [Rhizobium sp. RU20A]|nr:hypothetical protein [Rhizobium sp. RU20A]SIQ54204.1 hypothetical protein SAMN05880582_10286 [Rhizobium sp. RU20A]
MTAVRRKPRAIAIARADDRRETQARAFLLTVLAGVTLAAVAMLLAG